MSEKKENYFDFDEIINKKRSSRKQKLVEAVLKEDIQLNEKITKIQQIDSPAKSQYKSEEQPERLVDSPPLVGAYKEYTTANQAKTNRSSIKMGLTKLNYLSYAFGEHSRIRQFITRVDANNDYFAKRFILPGFRIQKNITTLFYSRYMAYCQELQPFLKNLLFHGWRNLTKVEYNLVHNFYQFCNRMSYMNPHLVFKNPGTVMENLKKIEESYLVCIFSSDYPDTILRIIGEISEIYREWNVETKEVQAFTRKLLYDSSERPSFYNILLALNMLHYRRFLSYPELLTKESLEIVSTFDFETNEETRKEIDEFLDFQEADLVKLVKKRKSLKQFKKYIPTDQNGKESFSQLNLYYNSRRDGNEYDFAKDKAIVPTAVCTFYEMVIYYFKPFLISAVDIVKSGRVKIFPENLFNEEIEKLEEQLEKMKSLKYTFKNLTEERYKLIKYESHSGTTAEIQIVQAISALLEISNRLAEISITFQLDEHSSYKTEYQNRTLSGPGMLKGMSVSQTLSTFITLNLLINAYFKENSLATLFNETNRLTQEIQKTDTTLRRIATPQRYDNFVKENNLEEEAEFRL